MITMSISYLFKIEEVQLDNPKQRSLTYRLFIGFLQLLILRPTCKIRKLFFIVIIVLNFALTFHGQVMTRRCYAWIPAKNWFITWLQSNRDLDLKMYSSLLRIIGHSKCTTINPQHLWIITSSDNLMHQNSHDIIAAFMYIKYLWYKLLTIL